MKGIKSSLRAMMVAAAVPALMLGAGVTPSQAVPNTALYLAMDGSGSITDPQFTAQITSYVNALNAFFAGNPSAYGQVAIGGMIFGVDFAEFYQLTDITDAVALSGLTSAIGALTPATRGGINSGGTQIAGALNFSATKLTTYETGLGIDIKLLIDVTTDGAQNGPGNPTTTADGLTPSPIDAINCLGIGPSANCSFVSGSGTNFGSATDFVVLEGALTQKLQQEVLPEPASLALLGIGLFGLGAARRRKGRSDPG